MTRPEPYSIEVADAPRRKGEGIPRAHPLSEKIGFVTSYDDRVSTLMDILKVSTEDAPNSDLIGWRPKENSKFLPYVWMTRGEFLEKVFHIGSGLAAFNFERQTKIGLYSINRPEWLLAEYSCYYNDFVNVPLYDTLGDEAIIFICNQTEMPLVVASHDRAMNLLRLKESIPTLKTIVIMDEEYPKELQVKADECGVELLKLSVVEKRGASEYRQARAPTPDSLCTVCYTSGTTGTPKGVMLKHSAMVADASAILTIAGIGKHVDPSKKYFMKIDATTTHISYLPLAHVYERMVITAILGAGAKLGFYQGDVLKIMDDVALLRPTLFVAVPRLLNRIYDKVVAGARSGGSIKRTIFNHALKAKLESLRQNGQVEHWLWDRIVFNKLREKLGGRVQAIVSASAPLSPEVADFMRAVFSCELYEAYGQTETCGGSTLTFYRDTTPGQVGVPFLSNHIKLVDVPEMNYTSEDRPFPRGEVCIRGPNCFSGYFNSPELTKETIDEGGWVKTGDIGEWDDLGRLRIIDRKKNLFKLSQGEYVAPEKVENAITRNPYVAQAFVEGNSLKPSLVAVIVPDFDILMPWARNAGIEFQSKEDLCNNPKVKALILQNLKALGKGGTNELKGFEIPSDVHLEAEPFTIENGLLTATMKLRRNEAKKYFAAQVAQMYANISL